MLPSLLLALREGLEIALIIGIVSGALRKIQRSDLNRVLWIGVLAAGVISLATAFILQILGTSLIGQAEVIFEGSTMLLAAGVLTWMIFWMQRQSRTIKGELESGVRRAALRSGKMGLFLLAFLAVVREGIELALFLTAAALTSNVHETVIGAVLGLGIAALLGWMFFTTAIRLDLRRFFLVTGSLLILFAAGMVAHGVHEFNEIGWIPAIIEHVWDINPLLNENSTLGQILKALFGYNGNPSLTEVLAYLVYFTAIAVGLRRRAVSMPAAQEPQKEFPHV